MRVIRIAEVETVPNDAATLTGVSARHAWRLLATCREQGSAAVESGSAAHSLRRAATGSMTVAR